MPSGYGPTREPLLKRMFFGDSAGSKREEKVPQHVTDCINKNLPRADARASEPRAWRSEQGQVILHAALLYGAEGKASTYTSPRPLTFVRKEINIDHMDGDRVVLSEGPPAGMEVVTVGAAEVYGAEFEVEE